MKTIEANFTPASLLVRVSVTPPTHPSRWGLTLDEARELIRQLQTAVAAGDRFVAELPKPRGAQT